MTEAEKQTIVLPIRESADLSLAMMQLNRSNIMAQATDFDLALIKTILSELATNIIKYGVRGQIRISRIEQAGNIDIEILATDSGPGIENMTLAMRDNYSTGNTLGLGLPAAKRMADRFSIESSPTQGTTVRASKRIKGVWHNKDTNAHSTPIAHHLSSLLKTENTSPWDVATATRAKPGEFLCGDLAAVITLPGGLLLMLIDVTGHGHKAALLANSLLVFMQEQATPNLKILMLRTHEFLKGSQGAAISLMFIDTQSGHATYSGVGNTGAARIVGKPWRPISKDGVLGLRLPTAIEQDTVLSNSDLILMWTDGISERTAKKYAEENAHLPAQTLASRIVHENGKPFDDAGCLIFRWLN